ncbi:MFS transporter [Sphingomonas sp. AOB5]|uniref:MFS transporter n=1 Tax=Sphingomonas sp. AOB5 TaxID=3034017 RepID=UPI0023F664DA|nr:MFS transporter [Sphingomonas sp. AOB5]MDF7776127.1 MFS transporter [Sphingomonas sp. AOB5]
MASTDNAGNIERVVGRRIMWRLVLPSALFILMGAIDRANVSFAALQMNKSLGFTAEQYGFGASILFLGFMFLKFPSIWLYEAIGMRKWLTLITLCWGAVATALAFIHTHEAYYALRFLAGAAEGGLSSGLMIYLSMWATERYRASILAIPIVAISVSQVIGAPLSGLLLQSENPFGWEGWRWMFFVEGLPSIALAAVAWFGFPDSPKEARWLNDGERSWLAANTHAAARPAKGQPGRWSVLRDPTMWLCSALWFLLLAGNYGVIFWLPLIVHGLSGFTSFEVGVIVALPWLGSGIGLLINAWHSDKTQERALHVAIPASLAAFALFGAYAAGPGPLGLLLLVIGGACMGSTVSPFWAIPSKLLPSTGMATGIVVINMTGSCAGLIIPWLMGRLRDSTGSFAAPTALVAGTPLMAGVLALAIRSRASQPA